MPTTKRKKSSRNGLLGAFGYTVLLLAILFVSTAAGWMSSSGVIKNFIIDRRPPSEVFGQDSLNILVLGCDEDRETGGRRVTKSGVRSDMMLVTHLDFKTKRITGLSIPRDTLVTVDGKTHKINAFHATGGNDLSKRAVEELLGIQVDRVVELDYDAFEKLVDMVGGVPITIEKNMNYVDHAGHLNIHLKKGFQTLNGQHAMEFVRFRHSDSDFARQERQHQFVLALKGQIQKRPLQLPGVATQAVRVMGNTFSDAEAATLARFALLVKEQDVKLGSVPVLEQPKSTALKLDDDKVEAALREYNFKPPISQPTASIE